jgi:hypothetical protein
MQVIDIIEKEFKNGYIKPNDYAIITPIIKLDFFKYLEEIIE